MPTTVGDVMILFRSTPPTHVLCVITADGQQDLPGAGVAATDRETAERDARTLAGSTGRVFCKDQESGDWMELP
jgi:hypothetical protein